MTTPTIVSRRTCRSCLSNSLESVLDLGSQYISDFPATTDEPVLPKIPLNLLLCQACSLVQLSHTAPRDWLYKKYWYQSGVNESMREALRDVVDAARSRVRLTPDDTVVDIGANDGTLLSFYGVNPDTRAFRIGIDPAENLYPKLINYCDQMIPDYFPLAHPERLFGRLQAKIVTSIAMFYDLEDPNAFVAEIKRVLHPGGLWVIQMGYLPRMLEQNAFDAICHEHLEYYSLTSLMPLLARHGLIPTAVEQNDVNGGSFRVYVRHVEFPDEVGPSVRDMLLREHQEGLMEAQTYYDFGGRVLEILSHLWHLLDERYTTGLLTDIYGASTKGNTILQTLGAGPPLLRRAIERSPEKWGRFTVGTWIPIVSEEEGRDVAPADLLVCLPWHFREAILARERGRWPRGTRMLFPLPRPEAVGLRKMEQAAG